MDNFKEIESKWQKKWEDEELFRAEDFSKKPKKYILVEFPYPSGDGLHVGHCRSYTALDILARKSRMEGYNVMFPMGWDAFGLPTENFAIKTGAHPKDVTKKNTDNFRRQMKSMGFSFDWSREINTTDPAYYKWTQWIFLQFYKKGLAYKAKMPINWCPKDKIGLANEEVVDGKCERCGTEVQKKEMEQWMLKITAYADKLIEGLEKVDYPERVRDSQINWIGRSEGSVIRFSVIASDQRERGNHEIASLAGTLPRNDIVEVFTTRLDTVFGVSAIVLAPENPLVLKLKFSNKKEVEKYIAKVKKVTEMDRTSENSEKTGVELKGVKAINPFTGEEVPVWIADYVLFNYGTGAVMMVPAHDERDFAFAKKHGLDIRQVVAPVEIDEGIKMMEDAYTKDGILINSGEFGGLTSHDARVRLADFAEAKKFGRRQVNYHLRDWVFSRQHYWGEPIPIVYCDKCGAVPVPEKDLPVELPDVERYEPTETGESPLAEIKSWVNTKCPKCGGKARRETDTMPNWAGSSWYYLRYADPNNEKVFADKKLLKYWLMPACPADQKNCNNGGGVDIYNGGMEHTTLHLLYSRFWHKFLFDEGLVPCEEPYQRRTSHGMVLGEGGIKMSKSRGNVINPDAVVKEYSADILRVYEMFMGPFSDAIPWDTKGLIGAKRFLEKVSNLSSVIASEAERSVAISSPSRVIPAKAGIQKLLHKTIKGVTDDINNFKFNTAISKLMIFVNEIASSASTLPRNDMSKGVIASPVIGARQSHEYLTDFIKLFAPFAPHLAEELWSRYSPSGVEGHSIFSQPWPTYDPELAKDEEFELVIQINGKVREKIMVSAGISEDEAKRLALESEKIKPWFSGKEVRKIIFTGKLINIVV
ncbi:MAG: leucine--tRNA ligase [bacterium]